MTLNVANCRSCGKIIAVGPRPICAACYDEIERQFGLCEKFLRNNRGATLKELCDETGVTIKLITKFIKEGRISMSSAPNLQIPCDICGQPMMEGLMCESCRQRLSQDLTTAAKQERAQIEELRKSVGFQIKRDDR